jgi:hypothetical protein
MIDIRKSLLAAALLAGGAPSAHANIGESFGFTSRSASLAGATIAWGGEGARAWTNPASLSGDDSKRLRISWSVLGMQPQFLPIENVVLENEYVSDKVETGDVDTEYRPTLGQALGLEYIISPSLGNLSLGFTGFLPLEQITYLDSGETFVPEYVLHRARTQRPQVEAALSISPLRELQIGVGMHLGYALTANAAVFLQTDASKPSTMRISASMRPKVAPVIGIQYRSADPVGPGQSTLGPAFTAGAVVRMPLESGVAMDLSTGAQVFGSYAGVDLQFKALSTLYYDPLSVEGGFALRYSDRARILLQADWQNWGGYVPPALEIQDPSAECQNENPSTECGLALSGGANPTPEMTNILIPRIGHEWQASEKLTLRVGYAQRPGIFKKAPSGAGNFLDPARDVFTAGFGWNFDHLLNFDVPATLDFHFAYHALRTQSIAKTQGDETDAGTGDIKIGAPGYDAGGNLIGGGLSLSLAF